MYDAMKESNGIHIPRWEYEANLKFGFNDTDQRIPVDMLIVDEVDSAGEWISKYVGVDLSRFECLTLHLDWPDAGLTVDDWREWAEGCVDKIRDRVKATEKSMREQTRMGRGDEAWSKEYRLLREVHRKLRRLSTMRAEDDWVVDERLSDDVGAGRGLKAVRFDPLMPGRYAEQVLWRGVEKVVMMSATVRRKTANLLGVADDEMEFAEYPSTFDPKRRPVIYVPSIMMNYRNEQDDKLMMMHLARVDQIIKGRLDRKGVIHAVSYRRAEFLRDNSDYGQYMIIHNSHNRTEAVAKFKAAEAPCILVSPSVDTGYDFSDDLARYTIIAKIPFASVQNKIVKARQERDPEYGLFIAAQTMVQMSGRAVRSSKDWAETFIVDDNWRWFRHRVKAFVPGWWLEAVQEVGVVPPPLVIEGV
jgi:Rad3-related DNA helicase